MNGTMRTATAALLAISTVLHAGHGHRLKKLPAKEETYSTFEEAELLKLELLDMAVSITTNKSGPYATDGLSTNFAYAFKILADTDIRVFLRNTTTLSETELTLNVDYTVAGAGEAGGGTITTLTTYASGYELLILRALPLTQPTEFSNQGGWFPRVHEAAYDKLCQQLQDLQEQINRCIQIGVTEDAFSALLTGNRAGYTLAFDATTGAPVLGAAAADVALGGTVGTRIGTEGTNSFVNGTSVTASGTNSRGQGLNTIASGHSSTADGINAQAGGQASHAEGDNTTASAANAHAEGHDTRASGADAHAEGDGTTASGVQSHAEGLDTIASGMQAHAEGDASEATGISSHAEGHATHADGHYSHAEGDSTYATGVASHAQGYANQATGNYSTAKGYFSLAELSCEEASSGGPFAAPGDAQVRRFIMRGATTDATPLQLILPEHFVINDEHSVAITVTVHGRQDTGANHAMYKRMVIVERTGGTVALAGAEQTIGTDIETDATWDAAVTADNTNKCPAITVTGKAATNIRWVALIEAVQIGYAD